MNIASNPWSFVPADVINVAITSMTQQANPALVNLVTGAALNLGPNQFVTVVGNGGFNGWYKIFSGASGGTAFVLQSLSTPTQGSPIGPGLGALGGGSVLWNQVQTQVRIEDLSWQKVPVSASLVIVDRNGNDVWQANSLAGSTGTQNRGKIMWAAGISLQTMQAGSEVLVTVN